MRTPRCHFENHSVVDSRIVQPALSRRPTGLTTLDVLRGFALLGILAMNIRAMTAPFGAYMYPYALFEYIGAEREANIFTSTVFDLKMIGPSSMLFGRKAVTPQQ